MSGLYAKALEMVCDPYLDKPKTLPRAWNDMTQSEQAMALWFVRNTFEAKALEEVARHAVAQTAKRDGGYDLHTANAIFDMFYTKDEH
jgi:hypothetical protein